MQMLLLLHSKLKVNDFKVNDEQVVTSAQFFKSVSIKLRDQF